MCSKLIIELMEKGVKYVQRRRKHQNEVIEFFLVFL